MSTPLRDVSAGQPEPVKEAGQLASAIAGVVAAGGAVLVITGLTTADEVSNWVLVSGGIVTALSTLVSAIVPYMLAMKARMKVTPLENPQTNSGVPLVPAPQAA